MHYLERIENLPLNTNLSAQDALAVLSQATGFDDQRLLETMPLLGTHQGMVQIHSISLPGIEKPNGTRFEVVCMGASKQTYIIDFDRNQEPQITTLEHDEIKKPTITAEMSQVVQKNNQ